MIHYCYYKQFGGGEMLKTIPKKIWYQYELWNVENSYHPTPYDDYLLLKREEDHTTHGNNVTPILMVLIDCHNDEFFPQSKKIDKIMHDRFISGESEKEILDMENDILTQAWLDVIKEEI